MPAISNDTRLIIWIITGTASFLLVILFAQLQSNINYLFRTESQIPPPKPIWLWIIFWCSAILTIVGTAIGSSAPSLAIESPERPSDNQITEVPVSSPPTLNSPPEFIENITSLSDYYLDKKLDLAILFSIEAYRKKATLETKVNLFNALQASRGVTAFFRENNFAIRDIEFNSNGSLFATSGCFEVNEQDHCIGGEIVVWETLETGVKVISHIAAHHDLVNTLIFSPDNKALISGSCGKKDSLGKCNQGELIAWDISNPKNPIRIGNPVSAHEGFVNDLVFFPNGPILLSSGCGHVSPSGSCIEGQLLSWKITINGLKREDFSISMETEAIKSMEIGHNKSLLVTGTQDGLISLWRISDVNSAPQLLSEFKTELQGTPSLAFSSDDKMIFSANSDKIWNILEDYSISESLTSFAAEESISFDPINNILLSGGSDKTVKVWGFSDRDQPILVAEPYIAHNSEIYVVESSPTGRMWVSGAKDGSVIVWDFWNQSTEVLLGTALLGHNSDVLSLSISSDEKLMASGSCGNWNAKGVCSLGEIILWDVTNPVMVKSIGQKLFGHTGYVYSLAFSPNHKILASGGSEGNIILWDITNPESPVQIGPPLIAHPKEPLQSLAFTPDGKILASGGDNRKVVLWDLSNPQLSKVINSFFIGDRRVYDIEFGSNDYGFVAADGLQKLILSDNPAPKKINDSEGSIRAIAIDPELNILATAGRDGVVYLWDTTNLNSLFKYDQSIDTKNGTIFDISLGKNHNVLASGSADGSITIWYLEYPNGSVQPKPISASFLKGHDQNVLKVRFFSNDNFLVSAGGDDKILVWNLDPNYWVKIACRIITRNFTQDGWSKYFPDDTYHPTC